MPLEVMFGGKTVAGAKWTTDRSADVSGRVAIYFEPLEQDAKLKNGSAGAKPSDEIQSLQAALYAGTQSGQWKMRMSSASVRVDRSLSRLVDSRVSVPDDTRPRSDDGKHEIVLAYDVYMTGLGDNDAAQRSVKILSACVNALALQNRAGVEPRVNFRSAIIIHADEPKGAPALTPSTITYIYKHFSGKTKGANLAAVYVLTDSVATQMLISTTSMFMSDLEKVRVTASRSSVLRRVGGRR